MKLLIRKFLLIVTIFLLFSITVLYLFDYYYTRQFISDLKSIKNSSGIVWINDIPSIKTFYATNRLKEAGEITAKASKQLTYGVSMVQIPRQNYFSSNFNQSLLKNTTLVKNDYFNELRQSIAHSQSKLLILWVHSYANSFEDAASIFARNAFDLNTEATYAFFSWPSQNNWSSYKTHVLAEESSAPSLAKFIDEIKQNVPQAKLVIITHGLGTRLLCDALDILYNYKEWRDKGTEIQNVILIAPDVDEHDFDDHFKNQILTMTKKLTVYVASNDKTLLLSHFSKNDKPLGLPLKFHPGSQMDETQALLSLMDNGLGNLDIVDATYMIQPSFFSHNYYRSRAIISDIQWLLKNNIPSNKRELYPNTIQNNLNYWVIPP